MKNNKEEERYRKLKEAWDKIEKFFRKDYPAILLGAIFTATVAFSILSYKQRKGKEAFFVSKANILGEKAGSVSATATTSVLESNSSVIEKTVAPVLKAKFPVNINTADIATLSYLPGIKKGLATRIIEFRKVNGLFKSTDQLVAVNGIGPKTFEKIKDLVTVGE